MLGFLGLDDVRYRLRTVRALGGVYQRHCNICGYSGLFAYSGDPPRRDSRCKRCRSLERHRLLKLWVTEQIDALSGLDVLHFAPEPAVATIVKPIAKTYLSADLTPGRADAVLNIEKIDKPDCSFDWIICCHVLEHVHDEQALAELHRVLRPGGFLTIMVPIVEGWDATYENAQVMDRSGRDLHFGQNDHVRYYGSDLRERITQAGFALSEKTAIEPDVSNYGLVRGEKVFIGRRAG
jgi:SAM-dependent methyltransferase